MLIAGMFEVPEFRPGLLDRGIPRLRKQRIERV